MMPVVSELRELVQIGEEALLENRAEIEDLLTWRRKAVLAMLTAATEIERLKTMYDSATLLAGAVTPGNGYRDLTETVRRRQGKD